MKMDKDYCKYFEAAEKIRDELDKEMVSLGEEVNNEEDRDFMFQAIMAFLLETSDATLTERLLKKLMHVAVAYEYFGETHESNENDESNEDDDFNEDDNLPGFFEAQSYCKFCAHCKESSGRYFCEVVMMPINEDDVIKGCLSFERVNNSHDISKEAKADQGKAKLTLVPRKIIYDIARVREYGTKKYHDPENWRNVEPERYRDAAFRHFLSYLDDPNGVDEESGLSHLAHLACNIAFLCEMEERDELDRCYKKNR